MDNNEIKVPSTWTALAHQIKREHAEAEELMEWEFAAAMTTAVKLADLILKGGS